MDKQKTSELIKLKGLYHSVRPKQPIESLWDNLYPKLIIQESYTFFTPLKIWAIGGLVIIFILLMVIIIISPESQRFLSPIKNTSQKISETQSELPLINPELKNTSGNNSAQYDNPPIESLPVAETPSPTEKTSSLVKDKEKLKQKTPLLIPTTQPVKKSTPKQVKVTPTPFPSLTITPTSKTTNSSTHYPTLTPANKKSNEKKVKNK